MTNIAKESTQAQLPYLELTQSFIEQQFPVAKVSMESYKERMAGSSQTLVGLGNWKGRKPTVLVRAILLGLLLPVSDYPEKDRETFLKLMTMDEEGLWARKDKSIPPARLIEELNMMAPSIQKSYLEPSTAKRLKKLNPSQREALQRTVFERMSYGEKLRYCQRPENLGGPPTGAWGEINAHLGTKAGSLQELMAELGERRFGKTPTVGDAFCGGGSTPFEAARMGLPAYGSDLNPIAAFLTWSALHVVGGGGEIEGLLKTAQEAVFESVDRQVVEWGIEHNSLGWRADAYLYCLETVNPEDGWRIPLLPTLAIAPSPRTIARLVPDEDSRSYTIEIVEGVTKKEFTAAKADGTVRNGRLYPPHGGNSLPLNQIRQDLRLWENEDVIPRPDDVLQERLYCVRWVETITDEKGGTTTQRHYRAVNKEDLAREEKVLTLLKERFNSWQEQGYLPRLKIRPGYNTDQPIREKGWTYWHHLFNPRQLLLLGLLSERIAAYSTIGTQNQAVCAGLLNGLGKCVNLNSRLSLWNTSRGTIEQTLYNQAFNTLYNYGARGLCLLKAHFNKQHTYYCCVGNKVKPIDARSVEDIAEIWITDPPYADAVNYDEVSEFFLAWQAPHIKRLFPTWPTDSRRELAVRGSGDQFKRAMVDSYRRMAEHMPDDGMQVVMFTHQDAGVWADLALILWAAGLRVTAAWTIATETESVGIKTGNNVKGTVILILRKRTAAKSVFLDEISPLIEREVRYQIDDMRHLDDDSDPNFDDVDYQLAAYAAALRVITERPIEEINPEREIALTRPAGETSPVEALINNAVKIACDHLIPRNITPNLWRLLSPAERFYIKGLEVESHGEYREGVYQELARGYGAREYTQLLESTRANATRLKTATEFGKKNLSGEGFGSSLVRQCLFAVAQTNQHQEARVGLNYLHTELNDYWGDRETVLEILSYLANLERILSMKDWAGDAQAAGLLAGAVRNDHI